MRQPSTAILGRSSSGPNRASAFAAENGCLFCQARQADPLIAGDKMAILNGPDAGSTWLVVTMPSHKGLVGTRIDRSFPSGHGRIVGYEHELYGKLPLANPANWLPPLSLADAFVVDELAVWTCGESLEAGSFVWDDSSIDECIGIIWEKRLPVEARELVAVFAAHGLPTFLHDRFALRVLDGLRLLERIRRRPAIKKKRLGSFANFDANPKEWFDRFILPGLE